MKSDNESKRKYTRWYFWLPQESFDRQTNGLAVKIYQRNWFKRKLAHAVIKDISHGGAGILVSKNVLVPNEIIIQIDSKKEFLAEVVYQRKEGEQFKFLGVTWLDDNDDFILELIRQVQNVTNQESRSTST
ncbi:PilZ domain-containing protein [Vibrio amylolyticus]|uniref:PilZ domain-containing protein n=1 Tax=Vibrio amylolyticus TaxID=2847292 RepID=UPI00354D7162